MIDRLRALHLGRFVREILIDVESEDEGATFVETFVRVDREREVENIVGVREGGFHRCAEGKFVEI